MTKRISFSLVTFVILSAVLFGCQKSNANLGDVSGKIQFNGEPLPNATVVFVPVNPDERGSFGVTNTNGEFTLSSTTTHPGLPSGEYRISIKSEQAGDESPKDPLLPPSYNSQTKLLAKVHPGKNRINLNLQSDGTIPPLSEK